VDARGGRAAPGRISPGARPAWFQALGPDEQRFLDTSLLYLPEPALDLLYLPFYARLTVEQIVAALQLMRPQGAADIVARRLVECWEVIL
jgi:hypothetical protein